MGARASALLTERLEPSRSGFQPDPQLPVSFRSRFPIRRGSTMALLRVRRAARFAILALSLPLLAACGNDSEPAGEHRTQVPAPAVNVEWTKFVDEFIEAYFVANPSFAVTQ